MGRLGPPVAVRAGSSSAWMKTSPAATLKIVPPFRDAVERIVVIEEIESRGEGGKIPSAADGVAAVDRCRRGPGKSGSAGGIDGAAEDAAAVGGGAGIRGAPVCHGAAVGKVAGWACRQAAYTGLHSGRRGVVGHGSIHDRHPVGGFLQADLEIEIIAAVVVLAVAFPLRHEHPVGSGSQSLDAQFRPGLGLEVLGQSGYSRYQPTGVDAAGGSQWHAGVVVGQVHRHRFPGLAQPDPAVCHDAHPVIFLAVEIEIEPEREPHPGVGCPAQGNVWVHETLDVGAFIAQHGSANNFGVSAGGVCKTVIAHGLGKAKNAN